MDFVIKVGQKYHNSILDLFNYSFLRFLACFDRFDSGSIQLSASSLLSLLRSIPLIAQFNSLLLRFLACFDRFNSSLNSFAQVNSSRKKTKKMSGIRGVSRISSISRTMFPRYYSLHSMNLELEFHKILRNPNPSVFSLGRILGELKNSKEYGSVINLHKEMVANGVSPNVVTLNIVSTCLCKLGKLELGFSVLGTMLKRGLQPDSVSVNILYKELFLRKDMERVYWFDKQVRAQNIQINNYTAATIMNGLCFNGRTDSALYLLKRIEHPNVVMFNIVMRGLCEEQQVEMALILFRQMVQEYRVMPDVISFNTLMKGCCSVGKPTQATELFRMMLDEHIQPTLTTYNILTDGFSKEGCLSHAKTITALTYKDFGRPDNIGLSSLLDGYILVHQVPTAWRLFKKLQVAGFEFDTQMYSLMVSGLFKVRMIEEATNLCHEMQEKRIVLDRVMCNTMIDGFAKCGSLNSALEVFQSMPLEPDCYAYNSMIEGFMRHQKFEEALELMNEMRGKNVAPNKYTYGIIIDGFIKGGRLSDALDIFDDIVAKDFEIDVVIYTTIIKGLLTNKRFEDAKEMLSKMEQNGVPPNDLTYETLAYGLLKHDMVGPAKELLVDMVSKGYFKYGGQI